MGAVAPPPPNTNMRFINGRLKYVFLEMKWEAQHPLSCNVLPIRKDKKKGGE